MPLETPKCDVCGNLPAQITCPKCEDSLCTSCDEKEHNKSARFREHKRYPYIGIDQIPNRFCLIKGHEDVSVSLFCLTCIKLICSTCMLKGHKIHETVTLNDGVENILEKLNQSITPIKEDQIRIKKEIEAKQKEIEIKQKEIKDKQKEVNDLEEILVKKEKSIEETKRLIEKKNLDPLLFLTMALELKIDLSKIGSISFDL